MDAESAPNFRRFATRSWIEKRLLIERRNVGPLGINSFFIQKTCCG
jgi:hypothetical protein